MIINASRTVTVTCDCGKQSYPLINGDTYMCQCGVEFRHIRIDPIQVGVFIVVPRTLEVPAIQTTYNGILESVIH